ncbi:MAG: rhomboid family intramembrane serine protease [Bacteroidia bacterium]|nr:rhomboid family intramembrane serine protease [Bacteroidia bacterium]
MFNRNNSNYQPNRFETFPPVVKNLILLNGIMYLITEFCSAFLNINLNQILGLHNIDSPYFKPYQLVTHFFMHGGFLHIALNMLSLWMFGAVIENFWGGRRFLVYYLVTGLGAAYIHLMYSSWEYHSMANAAALFAESPTVEGLMDFYHNYSNPNLDSYFKEMIQVWDHSSPIGIERKAIELVEAVVQVKRDLPMVGASGAVFGVLLAFGMMFPDQIVFFILFPMPAKYLVVLYGAMELYNGLMNDPTSNVAHFAHLGGMLFGFLLIKSWQRRS